MKKKINKKSRTVISFVVFVVLILFISILQSESITSLPSGSEDTNITQLVNTESQLYNQGLDVEKASLPTKVGFGGGCAPKRPKQSNESLLKNVTQEMQKNQSINFEFSEKVSPAGKIYINESEFYKDKKRSYKVGIPGGSFVPQSLKGVALNSYFKSKNLTDNYVYVMMQFETLGGDPTKEQIQALAADDITLFEYHGDHTYYAKVPRTVLETKSYDFVRWIGIIDDGNFKLSPKLKDYISSTGKVNLSVIFYEKINEKELEKINQLLNIIEKGDGEQIMIEIDSNKINNLLSLNFVKEIELYIKPQLTLDRSANVISADYVWSYPNDGSGVTVGIIDSGIQHSHNHFSSITKYDAYDYAENDTNPEAECGESSCSDNIDNDGNSGKDEGTHGVHVAGIVSGQGTYNGRAIKGISNKANLVIQRVFDEEGVWRAQSSSSTTIWENILDPDDDNDYNEASSADIISCSWGIEGTDAQDGDYSSSSSQVDKTVVGDNGKEVLVVIAAGNDYLWGVTFRKVDPPATAKNAITVGASADYSSSDNNCNHSVNSDPNNLYLMGYSERQTDDGRVKPDILAPGSDIVSSVLGNSYLSWDGTSMATPHVSAVAAQILKQYPSSSPAGVKAFLLSDTVGGSTTNNKNYNQGWGRLDAYRAIYKLADEYVDSYDEGTVGEAGSGEPQSVYYPIDVPSGADKLVVTLVWSDRFGDASGDGSKTLYNDIDLWLKNSSDSTLSWTVDDDDTNNVEKYIIDYPASGTWKAYVEVNSLFGAAGTQDYAINYQVIKKSTTPALNVNLYLANSMIKPGQTTTAYANADVAGLFGYDINADLDVSSGLTITSGEFDGSDIDKDKVGDIPAGGNRNTRTWTIRGDSVGSKSVSISINGKMINGSAYSDSDSKTLTVCNDNDNDGYFSESCGGDDCDDSDGSIHPGATEACDNKDNDCDDIVDEGCTSDCTEPGYEQCIQSSYGDCDVSIAINRYSNVNTIKWGAVNDAWDPYTINEYRIGWTNVDASDMYYNINDPNTACLDGEGYCKGGCTGEQIADTGTRVTVTAPGIAHHEEVLGYDETVDYCCWVWFYAFDPNYGAGNSLYTLRCYNDSDCSSGYFCNKAGSWSTWVCVAKYSNGQSCTLDNQCQSNYCDNDGVGLADDNWCFTPYNTYFDGQENTYCEYSTDNGITDCDERQSGTDLNKCVGISYYEDECSNSCNYQDVASVFECTETGCSCAAQQCDGLTTGSNINTCTYGTATYFADKCTSTAGGEDRGDNICRNSSFAAGCTASSFCNDKSPGDESTSTDECCYGSCTSLDCDGDDDTDGSDGTLKESEVTAGSCTSGCSSNSTCCDQQSITCSAAYECDYFHSLITNEDETPNNICYKPNSGNWRFASNAEATETACGDGYDNDCDGYADTSDSDCDASPSVTLESPPDNNISTTGNITFNCSATDDKNLQNISLYTNMSGIWGLNQTNIITGTANSTTFTINNIPDNTNFIWNCLAYDNASHGDWGDANWSIMINMAPLIIKVNVTDWKGNIVNETNKARTWRNVTFNVLVGSFIDFIDRFNNSLTTENLTFTTEEQISRYLEISENAKVTSGIMNLSGYEGVTINNFTDDFNRPNNDTVGNDWTDTSSGPGNPDSDIENNQLHQFFTSGNGYATIYRNLTFIPENFTIDYNASFIGGYTYYVNRFELYNSTGSKFGEAEYRVTNGTLRNCSASTANFCTTIYGNNTVGSWNRNVSADLASVGVDLSGFVKLTYTIQSVSHYSGQKPNVWSDNAFVYTQASTSYPTNPWLEVGTSDGIKEWEYSGEFDQTNNQTGDFSSAINSYLNSCSPVDGKCTVPFPFYSFSSGKLEYSDLSIHYYSDIDSVWVVIWNTTKQDGNKFLESTMAFSDSIWRVDMWLDNSFPETVNYTVYVNDSSNNIASYDGSFGIIYIANETQGRIAIETGINNSTLSSPIIYTDYYMRYLNESRDKVGLFDKVTEELNQTWAFNYVSQDEYYTNMTSMPDPVTGPIVNIWENDSLTEEEIISQVEAFINTTKT